MIESVAWALGATGISFAVATGVIGVVRAQQSDRKCPDHSSMKQNVEDFKSLTRAIIVAFSDIASIKQAMVWMVVEKNDDSPEGKALVDKVVQAMMSKPVTKKE